MTVSDALRALIRSQANNRCGYCLSHQQYVIGKFEIEHIYPRSLGGSDDENNLWLACRSCNVFKADQIQAVDPLTDLTVKLFNPRHQVWWEHFIWSEEGTHIIGITPCGRATVKALQLNNDIVVEVRSQWVTVGWNPPDPST